MMHVRSLLYHVLLLAGLLAPATEAQDVDDEPPPFGAPIKGLVFNDTDGNGRQDDAISEPGIPGVDVFITDSNTPANVFTVTTDQDGFYQVNLLYRNSRPDKATVDVVDSMLPPGPWLQTAGFDPSMDRASNNRIRLDGICFPATSPTQCCENNDKKVRIRRFLNRSGSSMSGFATIDRATPVPWNSNFFIPNPLPSGPTRYTVPSSPWLQGKMETSITVGFDGLIGTAPMSINTSPIAAEDWHIKTCRRYKVRIWMNLDTMDVKTKFDVSCNNNMYRRSGATSWVCWEMQMDV